MDFPRSNGSGKGEEQIEMSARTGIQLVTNVSPSSRISPKIPFSSIRTQTGIIVQSLPAKTLREFEVQHQNTRNCRQSFGCRFLGWRKEKSMLTNQTNRWFSARTYILYPGILKLIHTVGMNRYVCTGIYLDLGFDFSFLVILLCIPAVDVYTFDRHMALPLNVKCQTHYL